MFEKFFEKFLMLHTYMIHASISCHEVNYNLSTIKTSVMMIA